MLDHIKELRLRVIIVVAVLVAGGVLGYSFYEIILQWLKSPLGADLYYTTPAGSFNFIIKVASLVGIALAIPVIIYQMIMFVRPALPKVFSRMRVVSYTSVSVALAVIGAAFGFYIILPGALHFFTGFQVEGLSALIGAESYLGFVTNVMITFMLVFQVPLLLVIIDHIKPIQPMKLLKAETYVILGGLVVSFFVPFALDITTSLLIVLPIVVLYNISIGIIVWRHAIVRRKQARFTKEEQVEFALDEAFIDEYFTLAKSKPVNNKEEPLVSRVGEDKKIVKKGFRGLAMEFQKNRQASIDELRQVIERDRAEVIAQKVAQYNKARALKQIADIR